MSAFLFPGRSPMRWISGAWGPGGANRPSHPPSQNCTGQSYWAYQAGGGGRSHGISFCPRITCGNRLAEGRWPPANGLTSILSRPMVGLGGRVVSGSRWIDWRSPIANSVLSRNRSLPVKAWRPGGAVCGLNVGEFRCQNSTRGKSSGSSPDIRCFPRRVGALRRTGPASASDSPPTSAAPQSD